MAFDPLLATSILIFMIFSKKESLVPQYKTSDSYLHPYFMLYHLVLSVHTLELWISIKNMLFSHWFFSLKGNMVSSFHRFSEKNSHRFQYWRLISSICVTTDFLNFEFLGCFVIKVKLGTWGLHDQFKL